MRNIYFKIPQKYLKNKVILDMGTGVRSIEFLKSRDPKCVIAVSRSKEEIKETKKKFKESEHLKYYLADITDKKFKPKEKVDVIFTSFFFSAFEGNAPFQTLFIMEKLKKILKKDGILILVDFYYNEVKSSQDILAKNLWSIKDALKTFLNIEFPRQMPSFYIEKLLEIAGLKVILKKRESKEESRMEINALRKRVENTEKYINKFNIPELKVGLKKYTDEIIKNIERNGKPANFFSDYLIVAKLSRKS